MNIGNDNVPAQAAAFLAGARKVDTYESTGGLVTAQFAAHNLTLIPAIPANAIIHDNACGSGTVSRQLLASPHAASLQICATDIDQAFLDALSASAAASTWPMAVSRQRCEALAFADNTFTHSLTNMAVFFTADAGLAGAREIHRTLRPGGLAVANCWDHVAWLAAVRATHTEFRAAHAFPAPTASWSDGKQLARVMHQAGFAAEKTRVQRSEAWARIRSSDFGGEGLRGWAERTWAYLGGVAGWFPDDERRWDDEVAFLVDELRRCEGYREVDGEVWLRASQWVVVATK